MDKNIALVKNHFSEDIYIKEMFNWYVSTVY